ncbi:MAG: hypothetical protein JWM31_753 [Solirubrobacterales bacterium]|nr:hypothetical protein [Solirubrobacterales bacterium]
MLAALDNETGTVIVAGYAAVVATAALALELVSQWRTWATRVEVSMKRTSIVSAGAAPMLAVVFRITNHSGHDVKITHLGTGPLRRGGESMFFPQPLPLGVPGPFKIAPRDSITMYQLPGSFAEGDPAHRVRALISTSDGKNFHSKPVRVRDLTGR